MVHPLGFRKIWLLALLLTISSSTAFTQRNITPGLPWTVVTPDSLPAGAIDTAFQNVFFNLEDLDSNAIRWVYRVNCHIELTHVTDSNTFFVEVPRDPDAFGLSERNELIEMRSGFADTTIRSSYISRSISGFNSVSHPEYSFPEVSLRQLINLDGNQIPIDTSNSGSVVRAPGLNIILENPADTVYRSYAYFLQYVDSIWHPRLSAIENPKEASSFKAYPSPTTGQFSIALPNGWASKQRGFMMRVYNPSAALVETRRIWYASSLQDLELPANGPPGLYTVTLHDERGELAVGRVMKVE